MSIAELARDFTDLLKRGEDEAAARKYNADDIVSYEAQEGPMAVSRGQEALKRKSDWWRENHEVHGSSVDGPFVNGEQFALRIRYELTPKSTGKRTTMEEVALYTVKDGKVVEERFFY
ncbi:MAG TPA: SnoaL-like domain-containing protein [Rhizobiaceae bacterium]